MMNEYQKKGLLAVLLVLLCILLVPRFVKPKAPELQESKPESVKSGLRAYLEGLQYDTRSSVKALAYNPACGVLGVGYENGMVEWHDTSGTKAPQKFKAHNMRVTNITISDDGTMGLTNSHFDDATRVWDLRTGTLVTTIADARKASIIFEETKDYKVVFACGSGRVKVFDTRSGMYDDTYKFEGSATSMALSSDRRWLSVGSSTGGIDVWEVTRQDDKLVLVKQGAIQPYEVGNWVINVTFSDTCDKLYTVTQKGQIDSWSVPGLAREYHFVSGIKHAYSAVALGGRPNSIILMGSKDKWGQGHSHGELIDVNKGSNRLVFSRVASHCVPLLFPSMHTLMVASGKTNHLVDVSRFASAN
ncbi:WD40 repeat domain-containing protein [Desulfoluna spongiiphila]|uniref:WD40 repeat domain-containing protein n=1 Tax=Desulfoluna spongiiphila TaxID=419481 RepID=UPI001255AAF2|nr:hypothetical protein [Desulfoluna spongiiphila]VVS94697.1 wd40 repeat [Desulfoluna spongiiphila]